MRVGHALARACPLLGRQTGGRTRPDGQSLVAGSDVAAERQPGIGRGGEGRGRGGNTVSDVALNAQGGLNTQFFRAGG